ncbi:MAG: ECF-type sigma factor [Planctomycetota bacterium]
MDTIQKMVDRVRAGDDEAAHHLWERYFPEVIRLAGQRMRGRANTVADEEDVAISVMESFFRAARAGRFPDLAGRDEILRLLAKMTSRKVIDKIRRVIARPALGESGFGEEGMDAVAGRDPTPATLVLVHDEFQRLFEALPENCRPIVLEKLECKTNSEIAADCDVHITTVERRMRIIRETWRRMVVSQGIEEHTE